MTRTQGLTVALLLSVALNLLIGGALLGRWVRPGGAPMPPPMHWAARDLDPALHQQLRAYMRSHMEAARPLRGDIRDAMRAVRAAADAGTLDRGTLDQSLLRLREAHRAYQTFMHEKLVDFAAQLPPDQRRALLGRVLHRVAVGPPEPAHRRSGREARERQGAAPADRGGA